MLLNRESNPGLPRLVVSNHLTTGGLLVIVPLDVWIRSDAYAEIIATRPLGKWCTIVHQWMRVGQDLGKM